MHACVTYLDLYKREGRVYNDRNNYIFEEVPSRPMNITEVTNTIHDRFIKLNLEEGSVIKIFVRRKDYATILISLVNIMLLRKYQVLIEVSNEVGKSYVLPLLTTYTGDSSEKYNKRLDVYVKNTNLKEYYDK